MGLFSSFCSAIGSAVSGVAKAVGGVAKGIGKIVGDVLIDGPRTPVEWLGEAIEWIRDVFGSSSSTVGSSSSYDADNASLTETEAVNKMLADFSLNMEEKSDQFELECMNDARAYFNAFLERLEGLQANDLEINFPLKQIKSQISKLEKDTKGMIKKYVSSQISQDNEEMMEILKMKPGNEKTEKTKKLANEVLEEALNLYADKVQESIEIQGKLIYDLLDNNLSQVVSAIKAQSKTYDELEKAKKLGDEELERKKKEIEFVMDTCDFVIEELN